MTDYEKALQEKIIREELRRLMLQVYTGDSLLRPTPPLPWYRRLLARLWR